MSLALELSVKHRRGEQSRHILQGRIAQTLFLDSKVALLFRLLLGF